LFGLLPKPAWCVHHIERQPGISLRALNKYSEAVQSDQGDARVACARAPNGQ